MTDPYPLPVDHLAEARLRSAHLPDDTDTDYLLSGILHALIAIADPAPDVAVSERVTAGADALLDRFGEKPVADEVLTIRRDRPTFCAYCSHPIHGIRCEHRDVICDCAAGNPTTPTLTCVVADCDHTHPREDTT